MNVKRFLGKCRGAIKILTAKAKVSYAQAGEDIVINYLFNSVNIQKPSYLEIGTNQPVMCNNTYFFYNKGCRGVCIEPDTEMYKIIKKKRPGDIVLNIGIGISEIKEASFYLFPGLLNGWSTFSESEAMIREKESGIKSEKKIIPLKNINTIIEENFNPCPNYISIDVEGLDLEILQSLDFNRFRPEVICVETISFSIINAEEKLQDTIDFMHSKGYITYADTHINTIFCKKELFKREK
ncbi:MAG TPA: FkbM family methyltransferase [Chitinophagaceae bacterium]